MKKYIAFFLLFSVVAQAQWFYGSHTAQNLENKLSFKNSVSVQSGTASPVSGVNSSTGSLYQRTDGTAWLKQYGATTSWSRLATASEVGFSFATGSSGGDWNISSSSLAYTLNLPDASSANRGLLTQANFGVFNNKIGTLNGLTGSSQTFATGSSGGDLAYSSVGTTHTLNIPNASSANRGLLTQANFSTFNNKIGSLNALTAVTQTFATGSSGNDLNFSSVTSTHTLNIPDASSNSRGLLTQAMYSSIIAGTTGKTGVIKATAGTLATGSVNLADTSEVTGTLGTPRGGTATTSFISGAVVIATGSGLGSIAGTSGQVLKHDGNQWVAGTIAGGTTRSIAVLRDEKSSGTAGGGVTATTRTDRVLNTLEDPQSIVLNAASFTGVGGSNTSINLAAGNYFINCDVPFYFTGNATPKATSLVINKTLGTDIASGSTVTVNTGGSADGSGESTIKRYFTLASGSTIRVLGYTDDTVTTNGLGFPMTLSGKNEVYTQCVLEKL